MKKIKLGKKIVSKKGRCFIVAEISANHAQSLKKALNLIKIAKNCGADAVKLQTFKPESLSLIEIKKKFNLSKASPWSKYNSRYKLFKKACLPYSWHKKLFSEAKRLGITIFSSPFDLQAVDFLEKLKCPIYKIASPEITDIPLIAKAAKTGKPIIISLGLAEIKDIDLAVNTLKKNNCENYILLKCQAHYPAEPKKLNLKSMKILENRYKCLIGFSDHTLGIGSAVAAVVMGAKVIEKHIKDFNEKKSLDAFFSLDPIEFKQMVKEIRVAEDSIGKSTLKLDHKTLKALSGRKSILVSKKIKKGDYITEKNIRVVRPGYGLHPRNYYKIIGRKAKRNLSVGNFPNLKDLI